MSGIDFDFSELMELAADLESAPEALPKHLGKALGTTAKKVKKSAQEKVGKRAKPWRRAAGGIDYEVEGFSGTTSGMSAEIGYNKDTEVGKLGNLLEYGAPRAKKHILVKRGEITTAVKVRPEQSLPLAPGGELQAALHENEDDFVSGIEHAVADALGEARL